MKIEYMLFVEQTLLKTTFLFSQQYVPTTKDIVILSGVEYFVHRIMHNVDTNITQVMLAPF